MKRPSISLAMIVKNEAENLPGLFESIKDCFDEIHITDTGSTDNTVEVAKSLGAVVHHFDWVNDFAAARNASFSHCTTDYIMWLDGDDVLENRQGFINFRNDAMALSDYWIAAYHYSLDSQGKPTCTFARERVVKREKGLHWKYFVHEGIIPESTTPIKVNYTNVWSVKHVRSGADLLKDRSRNLTLFEKNNQVLDSRMQFYYGKELFEAGKPKEATEKLNLAICAEDLQLHDRILAMQYDCYAHIQINDFTKAVELANQGILLAPHRAEFYVIIGDCYVKLGRIQDAIPSYSAAKACIMQGQGNNAGAIFQTADVYTAYPRNQLARVYFNMGDFPKASAEANDSAVTFNNEESKVLLSEITKMMNASKSFKDAKPCDDIVITCPPQAPYLWDADIAKTKSMGGSETACIEMAQWLHKLSGRTVKVFNVRDEVKVCDGVEYIPCGRIPEYMQWHKPFLHIAWRHNFKITDALTYLWCHDLQTPGAENTENYEKLLCLTPFHKRYAMATQGIPEDKILVTRNGIRPDRFKDGPYVSRKKSNKIVFPSSPDRGLDRAMLVLDQVREEYPDIELHVFYGIEHLHKWGQAALQSCLELMMKERPWVKYHGATQQDVLMGHLKEAAIWLHPCDFVETSCITAMEMICAGVYPVTRRLGGLMDTLSDAESKNMATLLDSDCITPDEFKLYVDATKSALKEKKWERVSCDADTVSWKSVAQSWLDELPLSDLPRQVLFGSG